jgi:hypothetical protein
MTIFFPGVSRAFTFSTSCLSMELFVVVNVMPVTCRTRSGIPLYFQPAGDSGIKPE